MPIRSNATFLGHTRHPMTVRFPLGALPTGLGFDVLHGATGTTGWGLEAPVPTHAGEVDDLRFPPPEGQVRRPATPLRAEHLRLGVDAEERAGTIGGGGAPGGGSG